MRVNTCCLRAVCLVLELAVDGSKSIGTSSLIMLMMVTLVTGAGGGDGGGDSGSGSAT